MKLYLVQHGQQNPKEIDPEKNLSEKGEKDVEKIAAFLKKAGISILDIYHSGKARARQTAEILARGINLENEIIEKERIAPMDPIDTIEIELEKRMGDLMIVGHLPYLNKLASFLLTGNSDKEIILFQQGGVLCLEKVERKWQISWMIIPELV